MRLRLTLAAGVAQNSLVLPRLHRAAEHMRRGQENWQAPAEHLAKEKVISSQLYARQQSSGRTLRVTVRKQYLTRWL